jgi:hypothetical protein
LRQAGRSRGKNVIDCQCNAVGIRSALDAALSADFRRSLSGMQNIYGDGRAAERIVGRLIDTPLDERLYIKRFHDLTV